MALGGSSKFTEPFNHTPSGSPFAEAYFKSTPGRWEGLGLPRCQALAEELRDHPASFTHLEAPQLLKHTLGLRNQYPQGQLLLLWFRPGTEEAEAFAKEIDVFAGAVDKELGFRSITYQEVYARLERVAGRDPAHAEYLTYLGSRYFSQ